MRNASLYDDDIVTWSENQAQALRRLAVASPSNGVDWENVIEEIECLGRTERRTVESHLMVALVHIIKSVVDPDSLSVFHWSGEAATAFGHARDDYRPSMRRHLEPDGIWRRAFRHASEQLAIYRVSIPPRIPATCPFTLDALLDPSFTFEEGRLTLHGLITAPTGDNP